MEAMHTAASGYSRIASSKDNISRKFCAFPCFRSELSQKHRGMIPCFLKALTVQSPLPPAPKTITSFALFSSSIIQVSMISFFECSKSSFIFLPSNIVHMAGYHLCKFQILHGINIHRLYLPHFLYERVEADTSPVLFP